MQTQTDGSVPATLPDIDDEKFQQLVLTDQIIVQELFFVFSKFFQTNNYYFFLCPE